MLDESNIISFGFVRFDRFRANGRERTGFDEPKRDIVGNGKVERGNGFAAPLILVVN
jgi:hypothetical protein